MWIMLQQTIASARETGQSGLVTSSTKGVRMFGDPASFVQDSMLSSDAGSRSDGCQLSPGKRGAKKTACCPVPLAISSRSPRGGKTCRSTSKIGELLRWVAGAKRFIGSEDIDSGVPKASVLRYIKRMKAVIAILVVALIGPSCVTAPPDDWQYSTNSEVGNKSLALKAVCRNHPGRDNPIPSWGSFEEGFNLKQKTDWEVLKTSPDCYVEACDAKKKCATYGDPQIAAAEKAAMKVRDEGYVRHNSDEIAHAEAAHLPACDGGDIRACTQLLDIFFWRDKTKYAATLGKVCKLPRVRCDKTPDPKHKQVGAGEAELWSSHQTSVTFNGVEPKTDRITVDRIIYTKCPASKPPEIAQATQMIKETVRAHVEYPRAAIDAQKQGGALASMTVTGTGVVRDEKIKQTSGFDVLDKAVLDAIRASSPFAPLPLCAGPISIDVAVDFIIK